ncbi:MAG: sigma-54-dependent Fis family transcriptional regulator [Planctomycetes bacterium]|nr:sigma-54-dependent Fis family transcriptional regulator [Planctomycetota bacterium]
MTEPETETPTLPKLAETILIIEDEDLIRISLKARLEKEGFRVITAATGEQGLKALDDRYIDLVLLDYKLPDLDGLEILRRIRGLVPGQVTIMMTAYSTIEGVVEAMQQGAYTYVKKPFEFPEMLAHIQRGLETTRLRREVEHLRRAAEKGHKAPILIGEAPAMKDIEATIQKLNAAGTATALILGESGTGKNVVAKRLHYTSARADAPFMTITCTDFSENLLESELFGHQKGAFTGAASAKPGLFELADGGTIFLDEIGDMPMQLQTKLLRFLEERKFRRVGGTNEISVDVRIVAATNKDLKELIEKGRFREDLYYRLAVVPITIPPLRDRPEDIPDLARLFADQISREFHRDIQGFTPEAEVALKKHGWRGNVRELRNVIERALILGSASRITAQDLPIEIREEAAQLPADPAELVLGPEGLDFESFERSLIVRALQLSKGNQTAAARMLHMTRDQIRYRMEKFGIALSEL